MRKSERGEETGETDIRREGLCVYVRCVFACVRLFVSVYQCVGGCMLLGACTKVVLESRQFSSSSSPNTPRTKVVLQSRQFSYSSSTDAAYLARNLHMEVHKVLCLPRSLRRCPADAR